MKILLSIFLFFVSSFAIAQPINLVVGSGPGGVTDMQIRAVADFFNQKGHKSIVINKPGANQMLAANYVESQVGDNKTLLLGNMTNTIIRDFEKNESTDKPGLIPIGFVGIGNFVLVVNKDQIKSRNLKDFFNEYIERNQKINFGGPGSIIINYAIQDMLAHTKIEPNIVPYKSNVLILNDIIAGNVQAGIVDLGTAMELIKAEKVIPLTVISKTRSKHLPNVQSINEHLKDFSLLGGWFGLFAPPGVSEEQIKFYSNLLLEMYQQPEYRERFENFYIQIQPMNQKEFAAFYKQQVNQYKLKISKK